jgi:hypothetical protein
MNRFGEVFGLSFAPVSVHRPAIAGHGAAGFSQRFPRSKEATAPRDESSPPTRNWLATLARGLFGWSKRAMQTPPVMESDERAAVAHLICGFIRGGYYDDAEALLKLSLERAPYHAAFLNLMGAVFEANGEWRMARRYYGRAIAADKHSADAQQNMRRIFELFNFGGSREPIALGDEDSDGRTPVLHKFPRHASDKPLGVIRPADSAASGRTTAMP